MDAPPQNDPLDAALRRELRTGEYVRWQARPLVRVRASHFAIWLFAVPWTAFALFWTAMAASAAGTEADQGIGPLAYGFPLFGLPFILVGLGMMAMPILAPGTARKTLFAITNQRLIKITGFRNMTVISVPANRIGTLERNERPDGSGVLSVPFGSHRDSDGDRGIDKLELGELPSIRTVEMLVMELAKASHRRPSG